MNTSPKPFIATPLGRHSTAPEGAIPLPVPAPQVVGAKLLPWPKNASAGNAPGWPGVPEAGCALAVTQRCAVKLLPAVPCPTTRSATTSPAPVAGFDAASG